MKDEKTYWEEILSALYNGKKKQTRQVKEEAVFEEDYRWAEQVQYQLKQVFQWDNFNKAEARSKLNSRLNTGKTRTYNFARSLWLRAAIVLIAVLSGAMLHFMYQNIGQHSQYTEIIVPPGQMTQIKLSDGTEVWLNSGSVFKYPTEFDRASRQVYLNGEAFMKVEKNAAKPFTVNTGRFAIQVLGTSFNVDAYDEENEAKVTLVEGLVALRSTHNTWTKNIVPGQTAIITGGKTPGIEEVNTDFYTSWTEGKIVFRMETLDEIAKKLERWYNVEIQFEDQELKIFTFSGTFLKYKPIEQVFRSFKIVDERIDFVLTERADQKNLIQIKKRI